MKIFSLVVSFFFIAVSGFSQNELEIIPGEIVVQLEKGTDHRMFTDKYLDNFHSVKLKNAVSKKLDLYLIGFDPEIQDATELLKKIQNLPLVSTAGFNFRMQRRSTIPDDPSFDEQWTLDRIDAPKAWDISKGGLTAEGQEIVVAVIEGGDISHEDILGNIWINKDEIPDDGIDNDENGYTDDYYGINVVDSTDNPIKDSHSTSVMGIIGARGNNSKGISGVNWDIKLMIVSNDLSFTKIIESYDYVYEKRKAYNASNGVEGAFVVATNSSFGVTGEFPDENPLFPIWCSMYDSLGSVGVLSAGATTNDNDDVEINGDMPTLCSSDYLIAVTNTDIDDLLVGGYSDMYVDLSAPGKNSYTLKPNNGYGTFGGTSAATPHVAGAIGLLYSLPCKELPEMAREYPAETALLVKKAILDGVVKISSLNGKTLTGGRLNLFNSLTLLQEEFGTLKGSLSISKIYPNPSSTGKIHIEYQTPDFTEYRVRIFNFLGQMMYAETIPEFCADKVLEITTSGWAAGVYFVTIENQNNFTSAKFTLILPHF